MATGHERHESWDAGVIYVVGHQRPDTDAIGSALGYAWYLHASGGAPVVPARAGHRTPQTEFALQRFEVEPPQLLRAVAPTFGHAARLQTPLSPHAPLSAAIAQFGMGARVVPLVDVNKDPRSVVTPMGLARAFTDSGTAPALAPLARPCSEIAQPAVAFPAADRIRDHRGALVHSEADDFLVVDEAGHYAGVASRARLLDPPRARLILVDHNELSQAVAGAEEAEILAVLDHHRLGNPPTAAPIPFVVEPVGSTCTLVAEHCRKGNLEPPPGLAGMMLSGILSDTLIFRSPTTTERDRAIAAWLAPLAGVDAQVYGEELLRAAPGLAARDARDILDGDRKKYAIGGRSVSIAQVEVTGFQELPDCRAALLQALEDQRLREGLALAGLMITDVVTGRSRLLARGNPPILVALPFTRTSDGEWDLRELVSRKKQLIPALYNVLADTG
jgi:manganese-dependent inorganic pyrophosphatase